MAFWRQLLNKMKNVYTVSYVNTYIKNMFAQDYMLRSIIVSGEASNVKYHSSGHIYFTIKDQGGALACVMFAGYASKMSFKLKEGMQIEVAGSVSMYEKAGTIQLYATAIKMAGAGALFQKFEELKQELLELGMFDKMYKQPIPKYAKRVGIVTAPTGAAVQDIMQIARRRNPYVQLILYPAQVQGEGAKETIVAGIKTLENLGVDVIIVGRGGGSIEDLWAFNEKCVAQAIFDCSVPIVSAVGHETDTTIADYVADLRAPTPSAAAELTVFSYEEFDKKLKDMATLYTKEMQRKVNDNISYVNNKAARLESLSPVSQIKYKRMAYMNMVAKLDSLMENVMDSKKHKLHLYIERLKGMSPLDRIEQGFAGVSTTDGKKVYDVTKVSEGDTLNLTFKNGKIEAVTKKVTPFA